jgi:hypothetical protein
MSETDWDRRFEERSPCPTAELVTLRDAGDYIPLSIGAVSPWPTH